VQQTYLLRASRLSTWSVALVIIAACSQSDAPTAPGVSPTDNADTAMILNPLAAASLFVFPNSSAQKTADSWRTSRPMDAAEMDKIAAQPQASWFGDWNTDIRHDVSATVGKAANVGRVPVLVAYDIPLRDCGSYSAGGATSASAYRTWIADFAHGIGARRAVVVLEPDALAGMDCLTSTQRSTRSSLLKYAVQQLKAMGAVSVYVDAGNSHWQSASTMATRLLNAGISLADGFSLNVSNFFRTTDEVKFGAAVSSRVGGKHYVIDTSRNGLGPTTDFQWCNPEGRALGEKPTTKTGIARVDAFLWVKLPGESDGACHGYPEAGTWVPEYALGLAQRASYGSLLASNSP
jgi:endoglucanase